MHFYSLPRGAERPRKSLAVFRACKKLSGALDYNEEVLGRVAQLVRGPASHSGDGLDSELDKIGSYWRADGASEVDCIIAFHNTRLVVIAFLEAA